MNSVYILRKTNDCFKNVVFILQQITHCVPKTSLTMKLYSTGSSLNKKIGTLECSTLCSSIDEHTH